MPSEDISSGSPDVFENGVQGKSLGLLLTHQQNRRLLREWLTPTHEVVTLEPDDLEQLECIDGLDLLLVDAGAYERCLDGIEAYRADEPTLFRPVLLLAEEPPQDPETWTIVDDVVTIPVEKAILDAKIRGLLDRRRLSLELATSETEFRTLFATAPDPVLVVDEAGRIERANARFADLVGLAAEECRGRSLEAFEEFDRAAADAICSAIEPSADERTTITYRTTDGEVRYAECSANRFEADAMGSRQIVVLRDITERIHQAEELSRQVDRLEEFGRVLAHELRNPLSIASGWLEQARETGDENAFERVEEAHERMQNMISELLVLARQGNIIGERSTVSLEPLVTESWEEVATPAATLETDATIADVTITGDATRLKEVFTNLFRNAIEHGGEDVTVTVGVYERGEESGIYVADGGPGLSDLARKHLFEPGFTTSQTGSGFGLAIVTQIVEAHGWEIRAATAETGGARFEIYSADILDSSVFSDDSSS